MVPAVMPLLLMMAVRFRVSGIAAALVLVTVMAIGGTMAGHGPYHSFSAENRALLAQLLVRRNEILTIPTKQTVYFQQLPTAFAHIS